MHVPRYLFKGGSLIAASMGYTQHTANPPLLSMWFVPHGPRGYTHTTLKKVQTCYLMGWKRARFAGNLTKKGYVGVVNAVRLFLRAS